jgi:bacterioferritin
MHSTSIELLNQALNEELAAVHQYMYFHFRLDDIGYAPMANLLKQTAIGEMLHAEDLAERILFLGGEVEMEVAHPVEKIHDPRAMLEKAKQMEADAVTLYNQSALKCGAAADAASKKIFEELVADEESHWDQFDRQVDFIDRFGERYLALHSFQGRETPAE